MKKNIFDSALTEFIKDIFSESLGVDDARITMRKMPELNWLHDQYLIRTQPLNKYGKTKIWFISRQNKTETNSFVAHLRAYNTGYASREIMLRQKIHA